MQADHDFIRILNSLSTDLLALWVGFLAVSVLGVVAVWRRAGR